MDEAKALLGRPEGAAYEKRVGAAIQRLSLAETLRSCMSRQRGKTPDAVNVVLVIGIDGTVRDAFHPPNDPVSGCVADWLSSQRDLPAPPRDAWMVHVQVKLRP